MSLLEVRSVTKTFGSLAAVSDVSIEVRSGELRAIIGPNGAGKTTFFNLVSGLFRPSAGRIVFDGQDVTPLPAYRRVQAGLARTFQVTEIFPELTVHQNIRIAGEVAAGYRLRTWITPHAAAALSRRIDEVLQLTSLSGKAERLVGELAHGDQRAVEIAMALALNPRMLLLDEPTAGMGDQETQEITALIRSLHKDGGYTIVLIEHDMQLVFHLADRISVLDQGRLLAEGTGQEIASNAAVQAAYLGTAA